MDRVSRLKTLVLLSILVAAAPAALAQQTGIVAGIVRDGQGAAVASATVTLAGPALIGGSRTARSGPSGTYRFTDLPPGLYTLTTAESDVAGVLPARILAPRIVRFGVSARS
jgi:hypothetical protein